MAGTTDDRIESQVDRLDRYDDDLLGSMYRTMRRIRAFEREAERLADAGEVPGDIHLYLGQEAVATGVCRALNDDDVVGSTHRGHGHILAKGGDPEGMMAEIAGKVEGLNRGRGGSMHMVDFSLGIFGCNAIVGASVPHVAGGMLSADLDGDDRVGVAFFGDGAANEGVVSETLNLAGTWDLPVVFVCENNQYAVSTTEDYAVAGESIADRATAHGMDNERIDGQDVLTVYETLSEVVEGTRADGGPRFVECETYRYSGHFSGEADLLSDRPYREDDEIDEWRGERDPLATFRGALLRAGRFESATLDEIDREAREEMERAATAAREADYPPAEKAIEDAYADADYENFPTTTYM